MRFRHSQVLELTGATKDALRHWKKVFPPLRQKDGRSQTYTLAEVVAISIIVDLVNTFEVRVERLSPYANRLFELTSSILGTDGPAGFLCLNKETISWRLEVPSDPSGCTMVLPLTPIVRRLLQKIGGTGASSTPPPQFELPFFGVAQVNLGRIRRDR